jgi:hypothetical protein
MKNFLILFVLLITSAVASAQTMKWISLPTGSVSGKCTCETNVKTNKMCYALEYTPGATGTLTSYTTGFFVNCSSIGSPVKKNESCTMTNNNKVVDLCSEYGSTFLNSSGNTGNTTQVTAGQPIILHQVCFYIPQNETLRITEDEITDLTTSITVTNNNIVTEYPVFETQTFKMVRPDDAKPTAVIDFKASKVGDLTAQLDWTVNNLTNVKYFEVMHSSDGTDFVNIGRVESTAATSAFNTFQFLDNKAVIGKNHYKIQTVGGTADESVVRWVNFESVPFAVSITPNPAVDFLMVDVSGATADYEIIILDAQAKLIRTQKADMRTLRTRLNIDALDAGVYTIQVKAGEDTYAESISVIK